MPPSTDLQPVPEYEHFLNRLNEVQLRILHRMIVERLKLFHNARDIASLAQFNLLDRVYFTHNEKKITGFITGLNRRSASVKTDDGRTWNVSPGFLMRETG